MCTSSALWGEHWPEYIHGVTFELLNELALCLHVAHGRFACIDNICTGLRAFISAGRWVSL